jgi:hypothetical protein
MKNLLSENMMRFVTKNLTEAAKKDLVVKSIMETIEQHGLQLEVRRALTEADAPGKDFAFKDDSGLWDNARKIGVKFGSEANRQPGEPSPGPLVYQSPTSVTEASAVLQNLIKVLGTTGTKENAPLVNALKAINANNYYAILWKVKYGSTFRAITKSNYGTITDWISKKGFDIPSASTSGTQHVNSANPLGAARDFFSMQDPAIFNAVNRLQKYNGKEGRYGNY